MVDRFQNFTWSFRVGVHAELLRVEVDSGIQIARMFFWW